MSEQVLKISDFNVDFWVDGVWYPAVIDMNLELNAGKVTAIVGESGFLAFLLLLLKSPCIMPCILAL